MILAYTFIFALSGLIAAESVRQRKLPRGIFEWLVWGVCAFIIIRWVFL